MGGKERMKSTWRERINEEMAAQNDAWDEVLGMTLTQDDLDTAFDHGNDAGKPFTLWTKSRVYFCVHSSGIPGVESVPRNPCTEDVDLSFD